MDSTYITIDQAAEEMNVSRATAWKWIKRYDLPRFRFMGDRRSYIKRDDLQRLNEPVPIEETKKAAA